MADIDQTRLLQFARDLQRAVNFSEMLEIVRDAVESMIGYRHAWLAMVEPNLTHIRILAFVGVGTSWDEAVVVPIAGDAMVAEILKEAAPIVVEDARTDPRTNKEMVKVLGNRTIINVPLSLVDVTLGMLGVGTMGDEGVRPPTPDDLEVLMAMAAQLSVAAGRLRWHEERARAEREKAELNRRLFQAQKLESLGLLAGGVAHDFNNLLQVIIGNAHFLSEDDLSERQREVVSDVLAAADRGTKLSRELLAMGRKQAQSLEAPREQVFDFFSAAENLERLTPGFLRFRIVTPLPIEMRRGAHIEYRIALGGLPMRWLTEITEWQPNDYFVDLQRRGPYRYWHHRHEFRDAPGGTEMLDVVDYELPFGPLGSLVQALAVKRTLARIFAFRYEAVALAFPGP